MKTPAIRAAMAAALLLALSPAAASGSPGVAVASSVNSGPNGGGRRMELAAEPQACRPARL